jgi:hypothetical protein
MSREKPEAEPMVVGGLRLEAISLRSEIRDQKSGIGDQCQESEIRGPQLNSLRSSSSKNLTGQAGAGSQGLDARVN